MAEPVVVVAPMLDDHDGGQVGKKADFGGKSPGKSPGERNCGSCLEIYMMYTCYNYDIQACIQSEDLIHVCNAFHCMSIGLSLEQ